MLEAGLCAAPCTPALWERHWVSRGKAVVQAELSVLMLSRSFTAAAGTSPPCQAGTVQAEIFTGQPVILVFFPQGGRNQNYTSQSPAQKGQALPSPRQHWKLALSRARTPTGDAGEAKHQTTFHSLNFSNTDQGMFPLVKCKTCSFPAGILCSAKARLSGQPRF